MSFGIDVDILRYASDGRSALHRKATEFLHQCVAGREVFCLAWMTVMSYLRMATHAATFLSGRFPIKTRRAMSRRCWLRSTCRVIAEEEGFWDIYRDVTNDLPTKGNLVPDAHWAALLSQHGVVKLYTHDKDFRKFAFLDVRDPLG